MRTLTRRVSEMAQEEFIQPDRSKVWILNVDVWVRTQVKDLTVGDQVACDHTDGHGGIMGTVARAPEVMGNKDFRHWNCALEKTTFFGLEWEKKKKELEIV